MDVRVHSPWQEKPVNLLFDPGAQVTIIGKAAAVAAGLDLSAALGSIPVTGVSGNAVAGQVVPVTFAFKDLPTIVFDSHWVVMDPGPDVALLALRDVHPHFLLSTSPTQLTFMLRPDQGGKRG
ncbi:MAG: aspartyl protease family protein [Gemmataceae bacterium]